MATVYKTFTKSQISNRGINPVDTNTELEMNNIISNFIIYFKAKHL